MAPETELPDLDGLVADERYQALGPSEKLGVLRNWKRDAYAAKNSAADWTLEDKSMLDAKLTMAQRAALGVAYDDPDEEARLVAEEQDTQNKLRQTFEQLGKLRQAEENIANWRSINRRTVGDTPMGDARIAEEEAKIVEARTTSPYFLDRAKEAEDAMQGKRDWGFVGGKLFVNPELLLDRDAYVEAVRKSPADEEEQAQALAEFYRRREDYADELLPDLMKTSAFSQFVEKFAEENPDATKAEAVEAFRNSNRGKFDKVVATWAKAGGMLLEMGSTAMVGVGETMKKVADVPPIGQYGEYDSSGPVASRLDAAGQSVSDVGMSGAVEAAKFRQGADEMVEALGGAGIGLQMQEVAQDLAIQIGASLASGGMAGIGNAIVRQGIKQGVKRQLADAVGDQAKRRILFDGAKKLNNADEFASFVSREMGMTVIPGLQSGSGAFYPAYQAHRERLAAEGLSGEELEQAAREDALTSFVRTAAITSTITRLFGSRGVEAVTKLRGVAGSEAARKALAEEVKDSFAKRVGLGSLGEGFEESLDEGINGGLDALLQNPEMTFEDWFKQTAMAGAMGMVFGGVVETGVALQDGVRKASDTVVQDVASAPGAQARAAQVASLRQQGMDVLADALEAKTDEQLSEVLTVRGAELAEATSGVAARLDEIDARLAADDVTADEAAALEQEKSGILDDMGSERTDYNPQRVANVAVAELVDRGVDRRTALETVVDLVLEKYSTDPVTPGVLWREANERIASSRPAETASAPTVDEGDGRIGSVLDEMDGDTAQAPANESEIGSNVEEASVAAARSAVPAGPFTTGRGKGSLKEFTDRWLADRGLTRESMTDEQGRELTAAQEEQYAELDRFLDGLPTGARVLESAPVGGGVRQVYTKGSDGVWRNDKGSSILGGPRNLAGGEIVSTPETVGNAVPESQPTQPNVLQPTGQAPEASPTLGTGQAAATPAVPPAPSGQRPVSTGKNRAALSARGGRYQQVAEENAELLDRLEQLGVDVEVADDASTYAGISGRRTGTAVTVTFLGKTKVVLFDKQIRDRDGQRDTRQNTERLSQTLFHEAAHAAQRAFASKPENAGLIEAAAEAFNANSPDYDAALDAFMRREYRGFADLTPKQKVAEATRAIVEGKYRGRTSSSRFSRYLKQFLRFIEDLLGGRPGSPIATLVNGIAAELGLDQTTDQNASQPTSQTSETSPAPSTAAPDQQTPEIDTAPTEPAAAPNRQPAVQAQPVEFTAGNLRVSIGPNEDGGFSVRKVNAETGREVPFVGSDGRFATRQEAVDFAQRQFGEAASLQARQEAAETQPTPDPKNWTPADETSPLMLFLQTNRLRGKQNDIGSIGRANRRVRKGFRPMDRDQSSSRDYEGIPLLKEYSGLSEKRLRAVYGDKDSRRPDQVAQAAYDAGLISDPSEDALFAAIRAELGGEQNAGIPQSLDGTAAEQMAVERDQALGFEAEVFYGSIRSPMRSGGVVMAGDLREGDVLTVGEDTVEVTDVDDDVVTVRSSNHGIFTLGADEEVGFDSAVDAEGTDLDQREPSETDRVTADEAKQIEEEVRKAAEESGRTFSGEVVDSRTHSNYVTDRPGLDAARRLAKLFNLRIVGVRKLNGNGAVIRTDKRNILLNVDSNRPEFLIAAHELLHQLKNNDPALYADLKRALRFDIDRYIAEIRPQHRNRADETVIEEFIADYLSQRAADPAFWQSLAKKEPNLFQRFAEFALKFLRDLRSKIREGNIEVEHLLYDVAAAREAIEQTLIVYRLTVQQIEAGVYDGPVEAVLPFEDTIDDSMPFADAYEESVTFRDVFVDREDDLTGERVKIPAREFEISTDAGGRAFGRIVDGEASIVGISSPKQSQGSIAPARGANTYRKVLSVLAKNGVRTIRVSNQSRDSRAVLGRLVESGVLKNPRALRGVSIDLHPTVFDISPAFVKADGSRISFADESRRSTVTPEQDAEYLAAVEAGDMETAQRMVDEAAIFAGGIQGFKGFGAAPYDTFDPFFGGWFAKNKQEADKFSETKSSTKFFLFPKSLKIVDAPLQMSGEVQSGAYVSSREFGQPSGAAKKFKKFNDDPSVDVIQINSVDEGTVWYVKPSESNSQVKSADPVTYDESGNLIPLSQRFNADSDSILFSDERPSRVPAKSRLRLRMTRDQLKKAIDESSDWRDFYDRHGELLVEYFGPDADLFQRILSATSQAASVKSNVSLALKAYGQLKRGEPFVGYLNTGVVQNLNRIRDNEAKLSGRKIGNYEAASSGDGSKVVVDRHIASMLFGTKRPTKAQFEKAEKVLTEIADELGWQPREVQAALWGASIRKSGKTPESYDSYLKRLKREGTLERRIGFPLPGDGTNSVGSADGRPDSRQGAGPRGTGVGDVGSAKDFSTSRGVPESTDNIILFADESRLVGPTNIGIDAWHGTPHKVDKFRSERIGTGEGAQAFGHGFYAAQGKGTAEWYRDNLTKPDSRPYANRWEWKQQARYPDVDEVLAENYSWRTKGDLLAILRQRGAEFEDGDGNPQPDNDYNLAADLIESGAIEVRELPVGNLYKLRLKFTEEDLLDWDKPLDAQSQKVQGVITTILQERYAGKKFGELLPSMLATNRGESFYSQLANESSQQETSERLLSLGIRGIRYLDGTSRWKAGGEIVGVWQGDPSRLENTGRGKWFARVKVENRSLSFQNAPTAGFTTSPPFETQEDAQKWAEDAISEGSYNYVIFDENDIEIVEENGQPVSMAEAQGATDAMLFSDERLTTEQYARHAELEEKHNAGTITEEETAEAQRLVDKAAKKAGYDVVAYHGTSAGPFTEFDPRRTPEQDDGYMGAGSYFHTAKELAESYGEMSSDVTGRAGRVMRVFLSASNPVPNANTYGMTRQEVIDWTDERIEEGFDSATNGQGEWVVYSSNQIKSADPFTGVPLEQRFNPESDSILFSDEETRPQRLFGQDIGREAEIEAFKKEVVPKARAEYFDGSIAINEQNKERAFLVENDLATGAIDPSDETGYDMMGQAVIGELWKYSLRMAANGDTSLFDLMRPRLNDYLFAEATVAGRALAARRWYTTYLDEMLGTLDKEKKAIVNSAAPIVDGRRTDLVAEIEKLQRQLEESRRRIADLESGEMSEIVKAIEGKQRTGSGSELASLAHQLTRRKPTERTIPVAEKLSGLIDSFGGDGLVFADERIDVSKLSKEDRVLLIRKAVKQHAISGGNGGVFMRKLEKLGMTPEKARETLEKVNEIRAEAKKAVELDKADAKAQKEDTPLEALAKALDAEAKSLERLNRRIARAIQRYGTKAKVARKTRTLEPWEQAVKDGMDGDKPFDRHAFIDSLISMGVDSANAAAMADAVETTRKNRAAKRKPRNATEEAAAIIQRFKEPVERKRRQSSEVRKLVTSALRAKDPISKAQFVEMGRRLGIPKTEAEGFWSDIMQLRAERQAVRDAARKEREQREKERQPERDAERIISGLARSQSDTQDNRGSKPDASEVRAIYRDFVTHGQIGERQGPPMSRAGLIRALVDAGVPEGKAVTLADVAEKERRNRAEVAKARMTGAAAERVVSRIMQEIKAHPSIAIESPEARRNIVTKMFEEIGGLTVLDARAAAAKLDAILVKKWEEAALTLANKYVRDHNAPWFRAEPGTSKLYTLVSQSVRESQERVSFKDFLDNAARDVGRGTWRGVEAFIENLTKKHGLDDATAAKVAAIAQREHDNLRRMERDSNARPGGLRLGGDAVARISSQVQEALSGDERFIGKNLPAAHVIVGQVFSAVGGLSVTDAKRWLAESGRSSGIVDGEAIIDAYRDFIEKDETMKTFRLRRALGNMGAPSDVADRVTFMLSKDKNTPAKAIREAFGKTEVTDAQINQIIALAKAEKSKTSAQFRGELRGFGVSDDIAGRIVAMAMRDRAKHVTVFDKVREAVRVGAMDPKVRILDEIAKSNGWTDLSDSELQKLAELDNKLNEDDLTEFEQEFYKREMMRVLNASRVPEPVKKAIREYMLANMFSGVRTWGVQTSVFFSHFYNVLVRDFISASFGSLVGSKEINLTGYSKAFGRAMRHLAEGLTDGTLTLTTGQVRGVAEQEILNAVSHLEAVYARNLEIWNNPKASARAKFVAGAKIFGSAQRFFLRILGMLDGITQGIIRTYTKDLELFSKAAGLGMSGKEIKQMVGETMLLSAKFAKEAEDRGFAKSTKTVLGKKVPSPQHYAYVNDRLASALHDALAGKGVSIEEIKRSRDRSKRESAMETGVNAFETGISFFPRFVAESAMRGVKEGPAWMTMLIPVIRTAFNMLQRSAWHSPYGLVRLFRVAQATSGFKEWEDAAGKKKSMYENSLADPTQLIRRSAEAALGTIFWSVLAALLKNEWEKEPEDRGLRINLSGPSSGDRARFTAWRKEGRRPFTLQVKVGSKWINFGFRGGGFEVFNFPLTILGAWDQKEYGMHRNKSPWTAYAYTLAGEMGGELFFPARSLTSRRMSIDGTAGQLGFWASSLVPASGLLKTLSKFRDYQDYDGPGAAFAAQIPVVQLFVGEGARINGLGDNIGALENSAWYQQSKIGIPLGAVDGMPKLKPGQKPREEHIYGLLSEKQWFPGIPSQDGFQNDIAYETYREFQIERGKQIKQHLIRNFSRLKRMESEDFKSEMRGVSTKATQRAKQKLGIR